MKNDGEWTLKLTIKSAAHIEPFNTAMRQLEHLLDYTDGANSWMQEPASVYDACRKFHPDWRYDPESRELIRRISFYALWEKWEEGVFEPDQLKQHIRTSEALQPNEMATWSAMQHRKSAALFTAQMALYEGMNLSSEMDKSEPTVLKVWQHLYWFTRFFRAFQRITQPITSTDFDHKIKLAEKASAWKRDAWAYFLKTTKERPELSVSTIAQNYANQTKTPGKKKDYENYLGWRKRFDPAVSNLNSSDYGRPTFSASD